MKQISTHFTGVTSAFIVATALLCSCHRASESGSPESDIMAVDVSKAVTDSVTIYKTIPGTLHAA